MADETHFLAYVLCHGTLSDIQDVRRAVGDARIERALDDAPAGVFSPRQWTFWNLHYGRTPVPPMPVRQLAHRRAEHWTESAGCYTPRVSNASASADG